MSTEYQTQSEPRKQDAYNQEDNPVDKKPAEQHHHHHHTSARNTTTDVRDPNDANPTPKPAPLGRGGIEGSGQEATGKVIGGSTTDEEGEKADAPPSEGRVYDAVTSDNKPGAGGQEQSLTADLDA